METSSAKGTQNSTITQNANDTEHAKVTENAKVTEHSKDTQNAKVTEIEAKCDVNDGHVVKKEPTKSKHSDDSALDDKENDVLQNGVGSQGSPVERELYGREITLGNRREKVITLNVGGTRFETLQSTLDKASDFMMNDHNVVTDFLTSCYDESRHEYFLDRHPEAFQCVLDFLRSGRIHIPSTLCGPRVQEELEFWGISASYIEPCCWEIYNSWTSSKGSLESMEKDLGIGQYRDKNNKSEHAMDRLLSCRNTVWYTLTRHQFSFHARVYGWVSFVFAILAIFSFIVGSHEAFRIPYETLAVNTTSHNVNDTVTTSTTSYVTSSRPRTVAELLEETRLHPVLWYLNMICFVFFLAEYLVKLVCAPDVWQYIRSFNGVVDLLAITPDLVEVVLLGAAPEELKTDDVHFMPVLRVMRVFRIFRLIRHLPGLWILIYTLRASRYDLFLLGGFFIVGLLLFSSLIFIADDNEIFTSIPLGMWWAVITMTTVGYGDFYPVTPSGYLVGTVASLCGLMLFALTLPALVNNFSLYYHHMNFLMQRDKLRRHQQMMDTTQTRHNRNHGGRQGEGGGREKDVENKEENGREDIERRRESGCCV